MPPLRLTSLLQAALPELSSASRAVLSTLGCLNGNAPSARDMAAWVGLRDRYQLARALRRDGLPPLEHLAGWTRVVYWLLEAESSGASLRQLAQREHVDPAVAYRLVHRVTGLPWSQAQRAGLTVALLRLREHRGMRIFGARTTAVEVRHHLAEAVGDDVVSSTVPLAPPRPPPWRRPQPVPSKGPHHPAAVLADRRVIGGSPFDVAISADGVALVTRLHAAAIDAIRLQPFRSVGSIRTGPAPTRVVLSPAGAGSCAYVTNQFAEEIGIIDLDTLEQTAAIPVPGHPLGAALAPDGRTLFVTTNLDRLCAVSLSARRVVTSVPVPGVCPGIVMHPSGCRVYVPCWKAGVILETDARTLSQLRRFEVGGTAQDPVVSSDGLTLYSANQGGWLDVVQLTTGRMTSVALDGPATSLAMSPDQAVLFVGLVFDGRVVVIDRGTLSVCATIDTGGKPRRIAFDRTGRLAIIANEAGWVDLVR
jgi:YVTN family beta-propeller protein